MKKSGCIVAIIIIVLIPVALYCWICWDRLVAKGQSYECPTDYGALEGAWLNLPNDSVAKIRIYALEAVGGYADKAKGKYTHLNDSVLIVYWDWFDEGNLMYKTPYIDTLVIRGDEFVRVNQ